MRKHGVLAALLVAVPLLFPPAAPAAHARNCGVIYNVKHGRDYRVRAARGLVGCDFARRWSKRYIRHGTHPRRWSCSHPGGTIAFYCRNGGSKFYYAEKL